MASILSSKARLLHTDVKTDAYSWVDRVPYLVSVPGDISIQFITNGERGKGEITKRFPLEDHCNYEIYVSGVEGTARVNTVCESTDRREANTHNGRTLWSDDTGVHFFSLVNSRPTYLDEPPTVTEFRLTEGDAPITLMIGRHSPEDIVVTSEDKGTRYHVVDQSEGTLGA